MENSFKSLQGFGADVCMNPSLSAPIAPRIAGDFI